MFSREYCKIFRNTNFEEHLQTAASVVTYTSLALKIYQLEKKRSNRSSLSKVFCKKGVLKNFTKFTGKHLCQSLFFNKVAGLRPATLLKKTLAQVFSCDFCEISKNTFFHRTPLVAASKATTMEVKRLKIEAPEICKTLNNINSNYMKA